VELRASFVTVLLAAVLQANVLYTQPLSDALRVYGGVGSDVMGHAFGDEGYFGVHATAGVESQIGSGIGLFGEVQPLFLLTDVEGTGLDNFILKLDAGVNFHF
jgi:hypothetical protein